MYEDFHFLQIFLQILQILLLILQKITHILWKTRRNSSCRRRMITGTTTTAATILPKNRSRCQERYKRRSYKDSG